MGIAAPLVLAPAQNSLLEQMSYRTLNEAYQEGKTITVQTHRAFIGGVQTPWSHLNEKDAPPKIADSNIFATFCAKKLDPQYQSSAWKIHLSIHPDDAGKAWDIIFPLLLANNIPEFKTTRVAVAENMLRELNQLSKEQLTKLGLEAFELELAVQDINRVLHGMQITIYIEEGKEQLYSQLLAHLEPLLHQANICPGIIDNSDRSVGLYSSVRHVGKRYTSYEQAKGYKDVALNDPFKAIKTVWADVHFNWNTFDYVKHINKLKVMLQQVIDAQKKYDMAIITKREFLQVCDVAEEYFTRWKTLLRKTKEPTNLLSSHRLLFGKFNQWVHDGLQLIPALKNSNTRKIKEAEDIISSFTSIQGLRPPPPLTRHNGQRNLRTLVLIDKDTAKRKSTIKTPEEKNTTGAILDKLTLHRRKSFKILSSKSLPQLKSKFSLVVAEIEPLPNTQSENTPKSVVPNSKEPGFGERYFWRLVGGVAGAICAVGLGAAILSFLLPPLLLATALAVCFLSGAALGIAAGYWGDSRNQSVPSQTSTEKQPLLSSKTISTSEDELVVTRKLHHASASFPGGKISGKSSGFFEKDAKTESKPDGNSTLPGLSEKSGFTPSH